MPAAALGPAKGGPVTGLLCATSGEGQGRRGADSRPRGQAGARRAEV